jgi:hypothetical protein
MLSSHLRLGLPSGLLPSGLPTVILNQLEMKQTIRNHYKVVGANLCDPRPLQVKGKGVRGREGEQLRKHTINIISQR